MRDLLRQARVLVSMRACANLIPSSGRVDDLVEAVAARRQRPMRVHAGMLAGRSMSGAWVPTDLEDHLIYPWGAAPARRTAVLCHELGHILLKHDPALHHVQNADLLAAVAPSLSPTAVHGLMLRDGYDDVEEAAAERLGTLLASALRRNEQAQQWGRATRVSERLR